MNSSSEQNASSLPTEIRQVLDRPATATAFVYVDAWVRGRDTDSTFWGSLTEQDVTQMAVWMLSNRKVQLSWALSSILCLAVTLFFSATPLESFDHDPIMSVFFTFVLTLLMGTMVFMALFAPLTRC